jgi:integrase
MLRVDELTRKDIADTMRSIAPKVYQANRFLSLTSSLLNFAAQGVSGHEGLHWLDAGTPNVASGIARYPEEQREQNLNKEQLAHLLTAIDRYQHTTPGRQIRLIMLTLARKSEVLGARWNEFALATSPAIWTKPAARMKAKKTVRVPVIGGALDLLLAMKAASNVADDNFVFAGRDHGHSTLRRSWARITREAGLDDLHIHDLRHVGATVLASSGVALFVIARLLGHSNTSRVTERYSHLQDTAAADAVGSLGAYYRKVTGRGIEASE